MSKKLKIKTGSKFGELTIIDEVIAEGRRVFLCRCSCGKEKKALLYRLINGTSKRCRNCARITHGKSDLKIYRLWGGMIQRCNNRQNPAYKYYGGRGIKVCDDWLNFENFYKDVGDPPNGLKLERKNNNHGYSKENCMWASNGQQQSNKRSGRSKLLGAFKRANGTFWTKINFEGKSRYIGSFKTAQLANLAYLSCRSVLYPNIATGTA